MIGNEIIPKKGLCQADQFVNSADSSTYSQKWFDIAFKSKILPKYSKWILLNVSGKSSKFFLSIQYLGVINAGYTETRWYRGYDYQISIRLSLDRMVTSATDW